MASSDAQVREAIRQVLLRDWDPVEANYNENLLDEYDRYILRIRRVLAGSRSEDELIDLLRRIECEEMGIAHPRLERIRGVAGKLLTIDVEP